MSGRYFMNSRNFQLQAVGNLETIMQYLYFEAIDELIILNVKRESKNIHELAGNIRELSKRCFVPISAGGGISKIEDFNMLLRSGADKLVINTAAIKNPEFIKEASNVFGSQCVVISIDVKKNKDGVYEVYSRNGQENTEKDVFDWVNEVEKLGAGEIFLTSIDRDGTGKGYDLDLVRSISETVSIPVIASGGVGESQHLVDGIIGGKASAVSAANIFHFIGEGLIKAKIYVGTKGLDFPHTLWNF